MDGQTNGRKDGRTHSQTDTVLNNVCICYFRRSFRVWKPKKFKNEALMIIVLASTWSVLLAIPAETFRHF